jgi:GTP1/Obg family GTP-binding protein
MDPYGPPNPILVGCQVCTARRYDPCTALASDGSRKVASYYHLTREGDARDELERVIRARLKSLREQHDSLPDVPPFRNHRVDLLAERDRMSRALARLVVAA